MEASRNPRTKLVVWHRKEMLPNFQIITGVINDDLSFGIPEDVTADALLYFLQSEGVSRLSCELILLHLNCFLQACDNVRSNSCEHPYEQFLYEIFPLLREPGAERAAIVQVPLTLTHV